MRRDDQVRLQLQSRLAIGTMTARRACFRWWRAAAVGSKAFDDPGRQPMTLRLPWCTAHSAGGTLVPKRRGVRNRWS